MLLIENTKTSYIFALCPRILANFFFRFETLFTRLKSARFHLAFTLAEVLITLGIIGIVAALTVPVLINNYQKKQYVTQLKKAYTNTNLVLKQLANDYGCMNDLACTGLFSSSGTSNLSLGRAFIKYFKTSVNCETLTNQNCWSSSTNRNYDGKANLFWYNNSTNGYKFITADNMSFYVWNYSNNCDTPTYSTGATGDMTQTCGYIMIDINGLKLPNSFGRDVFWFWITNGKGASLYPYGGSDNNWNTHAAANTWWKNSANQPVACYPYYKVGYTCAGRIIEENWEMTY